MKLAQADSLTRPERIPSKCERHHEANTLRPVDTVLARRRKSSTAIGPSGVVLESHRFAVRGLATLTAAES